VTYWSENEASDEVLFGHVKAGQEEAFEALVRRYEKPLYNYLRRMAGYASDPEDLFQETFLRVYTHRMRFREQAPFRPWLYRIATNVALDCLRRNKRRPTLSLDASPLQTAIAAPNSAADALARREETQERLRRALEELPDKHRAVFLMARYEDMDYPAIAEALEIPVGTVKSRMHKAVRLLRDAMKERP
jgi:RNA polymerase sigma-70 factor, ECF subfamily